MIDIIGLHEMSKRTPTPISLEALRQHVTCDVNGVVRFYIGANLTVDELSRWTPQRITDFFGGMAKVIRAVQDGPR